MNAITLTQPWASLIASSAKTIETRSWFTPFRGPIAIHAAKTFPRWAMELTHDPEDGRLIRESLKASGVVTLADLPLGCVIATATLTACSPTAGISSTITDRELAFGDYSPGRFAWVFQDIIALPRPIPAVGHRRLWEIDEALVMERGHPDGDESNGGEGDG